MSQLTLGSRGAEVRELQRLLNERGYPVAVDGDFGTKTKTEHFVTLASEAVAILDELQARTGQGRYVFTWRDARKSMS